MSSFIIAEPLLIGGLVVVALLFGYGWGRRRGHREGFEQGVQYGPLRLRKKMWQTGMCPLCMSQPNENIEDDDGEFETTVS